MKIRLLVLLTCALAGSFLAGQTKSRTSSTAEEIPELHGFDMSAMDRTAAPCDDFYQFVCGNWIKMNAIPPDQGRWGRFNQLAERNRLVAKQILEKASANDPKRDAVHQKIGDYYQACMDEKAVNEKGLKPLQQELDRIDGVHDRESAIEELAHLHAIGVRQLAFFFSSSPDMHDANNVIAYADQGGLGLPDRDDYLKDDANSKEKRDKYLTHVTNVLKLAGDSNAEGDAKLVMDLETKLAQASMDRIERRKPENRDHKMTVAQFSALAPDVEFERYVKETTSPSFDSLNVGNPDFFKQLNSLSNSVDLDEWKAYFRWHLLHEFAGVLSDPFVQENFDFYGKYLGGAKELEARWKRCVRLTDQQLGEALGQPYVAEEFTPADKARMLKMVGEIETALKKDIESLDWMTPDTKKQALAKLAAIRNKIGYPSKWRDYSTLNIVRGDFLGNVERANTFEVNRQLAKIGKPLDRNEFGMTPPTVNAYYSPPYNDINFPAGILEPPFFDKTADDAVNLGGIGAVIGHELTHGFDDQGRKYDAEGNLRDWWTPVDARAFEERVGCIDQEYSSFEPLPGVHVRGKLTLGENTADNGGVRVAMRALHNMQAEQSKSGKGGAQELTSKSIHGFTPEQRLFIGFGQIWCEKQTDAALRQQVQTNPHSPGQFRVVGVVQNSEEFAKAFSCKPGQKMVSEKACRVW